MINKITKFIKPLITATLITSLILSLAACDKKDSQQKDDSVTQIEINSENGDNEESKENETPIDKNLSEDEAVDIVEGMIPALDIAIENLHKFPKDKKEDTFWEIVFLDVYHDESIKDHTGMDGEDSYSYKEVSEDDVKKIGLKYGMKYDKLPNISSDMKDIFTYNKKNKTYKVNTLSDAPCVVYEVVEFEVKDNNDIKVIVGYFNIDDIEYNSYEEVYEVTLKDMQPNKEEFFYGVDSIKDADKTYDVVDRENKKKVTNY